MKKAVIIIFACLVILSGTYFYFSTKGNNVVEEKIIMMINDVPITEKDIEYYIKEVSRDYFEEKLNEEDLRIEAMKRAVGFIVINQYFEKKNIDITKEEIEREISSQIVNQEGIETKDEYFDFMRMRGFSREEVLRNIELFLKNNKLVQILAKDMKIDEDEVISRYNDYQEEFDEEEFLFPDIEEVKELIEKEIVVERANSIIAEEINEEGKNSEVIFFE